jgi:excisionase family DNA binding protein
MPPKRKAETAAQPPIGYRPHVLGEVVFTTDQVAHDLHISVRTVLRAIQEGKLEARVIGKSYVMTGTAVREWWANRPQRKTQRKKKQQENA